LLIAGWNIPIRTCSNIDNYFQTFLPGCRATPSPLECTAAGEIKADFTIQSLQQTAKQAQTESERT
jgi:hypothetical protein